MQPYFYIIQDVRNKMYYAGAKWSVDADENTFMTKEGYTTSSSIVNKIIENFGLDVFIIRKLRVFKTPEETYTYETKFLRKVKAGSNSKFYNAHDNNFTFIPGSKECKLFMLNKYGTEYPSQSKEIKEKISKTLKSDEWKNSEVGIKSVIKRSETVSSEEWKSTKGKEKSMKISAKRKLRIGKNSPNFGKKWPDEKRKSNSGSNHGNFGLKRTQEQKEKITGKNNGNFGINWIFINNGITNRKIRKEEKIPDNWKLGKISKDYTDLKKEFELSGMSITEFSKFKGIPYGTLYRRLKRSSI